MWFDRLLEGLLDTLLMVKAEEILEKIEKGKPVHVLFRRGDWAQYAVIRPQR